MTIKRIQVKVTKRYWGEFNGELENIITSLQCLLDEGWVGIETDFVPYEDYDGFYLYKYREETDKEYEKRMKLIEKEKEKKLAQKEKRRQEYLRLKREFEND